MSRVARCGFLRSPARNALPRFPHRPTLQEQGLNVTTIVGYGLSAPTGTPEAIHWLLKKAISEMIADKEVAARLSGLGYETDLQLGDAYKDFIVSDLAQWRAVAKAANIRIEN